jgi:hypothetical protein
MWLEPWGAHEEVHGEKRKELDGASADLPMYLLLGEGQAPLVPSSLVDDKPGRP